MLINASTLEDLLLRHAECIAEFYRGHEQVPFIATSHEDHNSPEKVTFAAFALLERKMSNHRILARERFLARARSIIGEIETWIRNGFPALDHASLNFSITVKIREQKSVFLFEVNGSPLTRKPVFPATLINRLTLLHQRTTSLEKPDTEYLINGDAVFATRPEGALRLWLALHRSDLFEKKRLTGGDRFTVSEVKPVDLDDVLAEDFRLRGSDAL